DDARAWAYVDAALPVYKLLGAEERFGWLQHGFGHDYPREARAAAEEALERWLK
ncbi:MAG: dienelactone hydrolase, partial [Planctomycetes bacterium]|nr:dienelactone hydrolase [Planctomycetota bacterium]